MDVKLEMNALESVALLVRATLIILFIFAGRGFHSYVYYCNSTVWYICRSTKTTIAFCKRLNQLDPFPWNFDWKSQYFHIFLLPFRHFPWPCHMQVTEVQFQISIFRITIRGCHLAWWFMWRSSLKVWFTKFTRTMSIVYSTKTVQWWFRY